MTSLKSGIRVRVRDSYPLDCNQPVRSDLNLRGKTGKITAKAKVGKFYEVELDEAHNGETSAYFYEEELEPI